MRSFVRLLAVLLLAGCAPDLTSSGASGAFSLELPAFEARGIAAQVGGAEDERFRVTRGRVRIFVVGNPNPILDRAFNPDDVGDDDDGRLTVTFPIPSGSETATFQFVVEVFNASNELLYEVGPATFTMTGTQRDATVTAAAAYVGPGAGVTSVSLDRTTLTLTAGEAGAVRCIGALSNGGTTESFPRIFSSDDQSVVGVDGTGRLSAVGPGTTTVRCTQDVAPGSSASMQVTVLDRASNVEIEGAGQTASAGTALAQPIRVRVTGVRGAPIAGATVRFTPTGTSGSVNPATATTGTDGRTQTTWTLGSTVGGQTLNVVVDGVGGTRTVNATATTPPPGGIQGVVRNATTGDPLAVAATIVVRAGADNTTGAILATVNSTQGTGAFSVGNLTAGPYTLVTTANGFATSQRTVQVGPGPQSTPVSIALSPNALTGQLRIVLSWGANPPDLDALLQIPSGDLLFWGNLGSCTAAPFACLDVDDVDGFGPETFTITQQSTGTYVFAVFNYTADDLGLGATDRSLAGSGATVEVYNGNTRVASFTVPNQAGLLWNVFQITNGVITPINTITTPAATDAALRAGPPRRKGR